MIDYHCHLLWGLDDGPQTREESLAMARLAADNGIEAIVATPHLLKGYRFSRDEILGKTGELNEALRLARIPLTVYPGAEVAADPDIPALLGQQRLMTLADAGKYLLLELPEYFPAPEIQALLQTLIAAGVTPIIAHPERHAQFQQRPALLSEMAGLGALSQVTAMSLTGDFGSQARTAGQRFVRQGLAQMIASDSHAVHWRPPLLARAVAEAGWLVGRDAACRLVDDRWLKK